MGRGEREGVQMRGWGELRGEERRADEMKGEEKRGEVKDRI